MLVSRSRRCGKNDCQLPYLDDDGNYCIVFTESHLSDEKFDCGCRIFKNKYYLELNYYYIIWNEIFNLHLSPGERLVKCKSQRIK